MSEAPRPRAIAVAVTAIGVLVAIGGAVSVVQNTFAAVDHRPYTMSLGGLLVGLGCGTAVVGSLLLGRRDGRTTSPVLCAGIIVVATAAGYVAGGFLDNAFR